MDLSHGMYADGEAESLQSFHVIALELIFVDLLQVGSPEFFVRTIGFQHRISDHEHAVRHRHNGAFHASAGRNPPELGR